MGLIRKLFWLVLFLIATFCFVVLFEHGPHDFQQNAQVEFQNLRNLMQPMKAPSDTSDKAAH